MSRNNHLRHAPDIQFPEIPKWDFINTTQVISPVDNPDQKDGRGRTNNHLARITRLHPKEAREKKEEPHREAIWLTGIMHRNPDAMIDLFDTFQKKYGATFTYFDNPKVTYELDRQASQVVDYLDQLIARDPNKEFIILGASMGEILSRRVYELLNEERYQHILPHILHHFSVCGVSEYPELSIPQKLLIKSQNTEMGRKFMTRFANSIKGKVTGILEKESPMTRIIADIFFAPMGEKFSKKLGNAWKKRHGGTEENAKRMGEHLNRTHRKRGAKSLTPVHWDIFETIHNTEMGQEGGQLKTPPATILWSENDPTYSNPEGNAHKDASFYKKAKLKPIGKANHVDVVFESDMYLDVILKNIPAQWEQKEKDEVTLPQPNGDI